MSGPNLNIELDPITAALSSNADLIAFGLKPKKPQRQKRLKLTLIQDHHVSEHFGGSSNPRGKRLIPQNVHSDLTGGPTRADTSRV